MRPWPGEWKGKDHENFLQGDEGASLEEKIAILDQLEHKRVLIVGYGRAGSRHAKIAQSFGLHVTVVEPDMSKANLIIQHHPSWTWWRDLSAPLRSLASYDAAVIATSPDLHIEQAKRCLDVGISRVLIEKPLCGFGQLERGRGLPPDRVVVAYNYRYHPVLESAGWLPYRVNWDRWQMEAVQYRPSLPEWGLLLDHVSHDFDIVRMLAGELRITGARHYKDEVQDHWAIEGELGDGGRVSIYETVRYSRATTREVVILNPKGEVISIEPDKSMYSRMWRYFLDRQSVRTFTSLSDAIAVQALLEECARYDQNT